MSKLFSPVKMKDECTPPIFSPLKMPESDSEGDDAMPHLCNPTTDDSNDDEQPAQQDEHFLQRHAPELLLKNGNRRRKQWGERKNNNIGRRFKKGKKKGKYTKSGKYAKSKSTTVPAAKPDNKTPDAREKRLERERFLIGMLYYELSLGSPPPEEWGGQYGTVVTIMQNLRLQGASRNKVKRVIKDAYDKHTSGPTYDGKIKHNGGRPFEIKPGSDEETMVADCMEQGFSFEDTACFINEDREERGELFNFVGVNAVRGAFNRMQKKVNSIFKRSQGSDDPASDWCRARYNWTEQLRVRLGFKPDLSYIKDTNGGNLPDAFNEDILREKGLMIHPESILWVDETHRNCIRADLGAKFQKQCQFPRDEEGNYSENGTFQEGATESTNKYNKQVRMSLLCAQRRDPPGSGHLVGHCLPSWVYSQERLKSKSEYDTMEKEEVRRVKALKNGSHWMDDPRPEGRLYEGDGPEKLSGVGDAKKNALVEVGLNTLLESAISTESPMKSTPFSTE